ncbi:MAG: hypothetical protein QME75_12600 [Deltaproteobacteria bacterium]|nr:hypothetical protein [Deltaproteobacteria bacterium]
MKTYSGSRLHERPRRFFWQGRWREVQRVLDRWQTPDYLFFKVAADDGSTYLLRYQPLPDTWEIISR